MRLGHSVWAKYREAGEIIDLDGLFSDYWSSNNRDFTVLSQSINQQSAQGLIEKDRVCCHWKV